MNTSNLPYRSLTISRREKERKRKIYVRKKGRAPSKGGEEEQVETGTSIIVSPEDKGDGGEIRERNPVFNEMNLLVKGSLFESLPGSCWTLHFPAFSRLFASFP